MSNHEPIQQKNGENLSLFDMLFAFGKQEPKDIKKVQSDIRQVINLIKKLLKQDVGEIQRVCKGNKNLQIISKFFFHQKLNLLVVNLFNHLMLNSKILDFFIKINIPLIIYRNLVRIMERYFDKETNHILIVEKDKQFEENIKFVYEYCKISPNKIPRSYANLISILLNQYSTSKTTQPSVLILTMDISIEILKNNFTLAAQSEILQKIFNKIISGDVQLQKTKIILQIIIGYCNSKQTRHILHGCIDLGKVFARFNNADSKDMKQGNKTISNLQYEQKLIKSCIIIEILLSSWPTLIYFIAQKTSLTNFINGLARKSSLEIQMIKTHILKKIIIRTLKYSKQRMFKSMNMFGYKSNYLNYRGLVLINFLLKNDTIYETFEAISNEGELLQSLSSLCLEYFPHISQNEKYSKKIIKNIKYPKHYETFIAKEAYKKKLQSYNEQTLIGLKSLHKPSLISYDFQPNQLKGHLIWLKQNHLIFDSFSQQLKDQIEINLQEVKAQSQNQQRINKNDNMSLLANFYKVGIQACHYIPWKGQNLKFAKFLSAILEYLINNDQSLAFTILLRIFKSLFKRPKVKYCRYLICSILDDFGKYLTFNQEFQSAIKFNCKNDDYAFLISKLLLNIDYEKPNGKLTKPQFQSELFSPKKILEDICEKEGSEFIILQIIEIIKKIYFQNIQKNLPEPTELIEMISTKLIEHKNEEIVSSCLQFFEQIEMRRRGSLEKYIMMIKIDKINAEYHKKKVAYLFLNFQGKFQSVTQIYPQLFKQQLENWINKGSSMLKQYRNFLTKEVKRFNNLHIKQKENMLYNFLGFEEQQRQSLVNLPWNVLINGECFPALAEYRMLKEKLKLRVRASIVIKGQTTISLLNVGMNSFGKDINDSSQAQSRTLITIRIEEIQNSYERKSIKQAKEKNCKFFVTKQQVTLFFSVDYNGNFILQKLNINIHLEQNIYRPLAYPHNFIYLLTLTKSGMQFIKKEKVFDKVIEKLISPQTSVESIKQNLIFLGCLCSGHQELKQSIEKKQFYDGLIKGFWKTFLQTSNYEIKEICHWVMNILIKDQDFQAKIKSEKQKKGKFVQTKYSGALFYYHYFPNQTILKYQEYDNLQFVRQQMPQKLMNQQEFRQIHQILNSQLKDSRKETRYLEEKDPKYAEILHKRANYTKKIQSLRQSEFTNPKVLENLLKYQSLINFGCNKANLIFEAYKKYIESSKFESDFPNGLCLP